MNGPGAGFGVVKNGDTVRRLAASTPPRMLEVLAHLARVGFDGAPRALGRDTAGRFIFTFIPGVVATPPYQDWVLSDATLASVARLLRRYHNAVANFSPAWKVDASPDAPLPSGQLIAAHLDVSLANVVVRDGVAVALIDFEEVALSPALADVVRTARHWCPLIDPVDLRDGLEPLVGQHLRRLKVFASSYGLETDDRRAFPAELLANIDRTYARMRDGAAAGHPGYIREWTGSHATRNRRARAWARGQIDAIAEALET